MFKNLQNLNLISFDMRFVSIRCFHISSTLNKIHLRNTKNRSQSSQDWLKRQLNDPYVKRARYDNYRARSVFKLMEIDQKYGLFHPGMIVVECGASPGSWTQYIVKRLKLDEENQYKTGAVIAIDKRAISPIPGAIVMPNTDFTKPLNQSKILHSLNGKLVDIVVSDMAPNSSGHRDYDSTVIHGLCYSAVQFAITVLKPMTGVFLTKIWEGSQTPLFTNDLKAFFEEIKHIRPDATRDNSTESYILCSNFKEIKQKIT